MFGCLNATDYIAVRLSYALKLPIRLRGPFSIYYETKVLSLLFPRKRSITSFETVTGRLAGDYKVGDDKYKVIIIDASKNNSNVIEKVILAAVNRRRQKVTDEDKVAGCFLTGLLWSMSLF